MNVRSIILAAVGAVAVMLTATSAEAGDHRRGGYGDHRGGYHHQQYHYQEYGHQGYRHQGYRPQHH